MKYKFIIYLAFLSFTSCTVFFHKTPRYIKANDNLKYTTTDTQLSEILNINSYFTYNDTLNSGYIWSTHLNLMFFEDGMFASDFESDNRKKHEVGIEMPRYFRKIIELRKNEEKEPGFYKFSAWGYYKLSGDTIKVKYVNRPALGGMSYQWYALEIWYKIIDKNHLMEIYRLPFSETGISNERFMNNESNKRIYYCCPLNEKPESDGWIKYKKWFWLNKENYKEWRKSMKHK